MSDEDDERLRNIARPYTRAELIARERETGRKLAEKRKRLQGVREAWVQKHGSPRLVKALEAGLLPRSLGVYRDERLAKELPTYEWDRGRKVSQILNPSEKALDMLALEAERFPGDAELVSVHDDGEWREAIAVDHPFPDDEDTPGTALLFVELR